MPASDTEPKPANLNVRLPAPLHSWLEEEAKAENMNVSEFVRYLLLNVKRAGR